jgi:hypothetical protein
MKLDPKKREEKYAESALVDRPLYPWGLSVTLDEEALDALGMTELPEVGKPMRLEALVDVTSVSSNESKGGASRSVSLQITDLCLEKPGAKASTESKLYAKG